MKKINKYIVFCLSLLVSVAGKGEEGMWLLPQLKEQNLSDMLKLGLQLNIDDIYNPDAPSIKDAVVIFGGGCTGEIISEQGLVLTNHHCGYSYIQDHSTVENNYLQNGFWAMKKEDELPTPELQVTFIDKIEDVTNYVKNELQNDTLYDGLYFLSPMYLNTLAYEYVGADFTEKNPYITLEIKPFYEGNAYYLFYKKTYYDVRFVGAPPSSIGKFGGDTDNWMWPRHTGDFSLFRVYTDKDGNPAAYSKDNIPLHPKKYLPISIKGINENDFSFIIGFPGETDRYATSYEIKEIKDIINKERIQIRGEKQKIMLAEMQSDEQINIQYADKYSRSSNYWKNSIGMNECIDKLDVIKKKQFSEENYIQWAKKNQYQKYINALDSIRLNVEKRADLMKRFIALQEALILGVGFSNVPIDTDSLLMAINAKEELETEKFVVNLNSEFKDYYDKNYNPEVDRKVSKKMLSLYAEMIEKDKRPFFFRFIDEKYGGNYDEFVDDCFKTSIFATPQNFAKFRSNPTAEALNADLMLLFAKSVNKEYENLFLDYYGKSLIDDIYIKEYIEGVLKMKEGMPAYPDANFTMRLTYGTIKPYSPVDAVEYNYFTTLKGVMEKENKNSWEFTVPSKLSQLYKDKDFGKYAMADGRLPVCFITTHDITGGNSGSPVINASGELIGIAFDGNWEAMSGDIIFEPDLQRTISVDIRYVLFIIDKYAGAKHLIEEMNIRE